MQIEHKRRNLIFWSYMIWYLVKVRKILDIFDILEETKDTKSFPDNETSNLKLSIYLQILYYKNPQFNSSNLAKSIRIQ